MNKNKKNILLTLSLLLAAAALLGIWLAFKPASSAGLKEFEVKVIDPQGETWQTTMESVQEYLGPALEEEGLIEGEDGPYGLFITTVNGIEADTDKGTFWQIWIGEDLAQSGADAIVLEDGQIYTLEYARFDS